MSNKYLPSKDAELTIWLQNFATVANANLLALGLVAGDLTPITTLQTTFTTNLNDVEAKKAALASAVSTKDATKDSIIQKVRVVVNKIQANPTVIPAMKAQLGISTREGGQYPAHPVVPDQLFAEILSDGSIQLKWNRNGNAPNAQFVIEAKIGNATAFNLLDVVTRTNYVHSGVTGGTRVEYGVKARRNGETSGFSNIAIVNAGGTVSPNV